MLYYQVLCQYLIPINNITQVVSHHVCQLCLHRGYISVFLFSLQDDGHKWSGHKSNRTQESQRTLSRVTYLTMLTTCACVLECVRHSAPNGAGLDLRGLLSFIITWTGCLRNTHAHTHTHTPTISLGL